jgi:hypothetical protein
MRKIVIGQRQGRKLLINIDGTKENKSARLEKQY